MAGNVCKNATNFRKTPTSIPLSFPLIGYFESWENTFHPLIPVRGPVFLEAKKGWCDSHVTHFTMDTKKPVDYK